ncbi:uncharacterized protein [Aquarana catesbeiana]|uniref:uncharacterized protein n=1 Tax=Aquarana catesbeiana TaxID=8400 RepID=UPI003CCA0EB6
MEASRASPAGSSQPSPGPSVDMPSSVQTMACDLSAPGKDEGSEAIQERVVAGIKALNRERDKLYKLRAELKRLRRQREGLHSQKRGSMDPEIQLAKVRVEHQETIVSIMEGRDGPFKEKFYNDKRFARMTKMEVEEETPSSDPLPPQVEVSSPMPSQDSGGMLKVIQAMESPLRGDQLVFHEEDITDNVPDKVKPVKPHVVHKTVFVTDTDNVPSDNQAASPMCSNAVPADAAVQESLHLKNDIPADELQHSAEPINPHLAESEAVCPKPAEDSTAQLQETAGIAAETVTIPDKNVDICVTDKNHPSTSVMNNGPSTSVMDSPTNSVQVVNNNSNVQTAVTSVWGLGPDKPTFAQVVRSAPGSSAPKRGFPLQPTTLGTPGSGLGSLASAGGPRRNVVILKWEGGAIPPARRAVVDLILEMGFGANDLYALIHVAGTRDYTISFTRPEGLDLFWERYEARCRSRPEWEGLAPVAVSQRSTVKKITIILTNESVPARDLEVWLRNYGEVLTKPSKILDERNIWTGGWSVTVRLARDGNVVRHLPSSAFIGRDRMTIFYPGQPKLCHRCGEKGHLSSSCSALICSVCRGQGHMAKDCTEMIRCNLCLRLGHPYSRCPEAWHNMEKEVIDDMSRLDRMEGEAPGVPSSSAVTVSPGPAQDPSPVPVATPHVSVSIPSVSVSVSPQPTVPSPLVSEPSKSVPPESVTPQESTPPKSDSKGAPPPPAVVVGTKKVASSSVKKSSVKTSQKKLLNKLNKCFLFTERLDELYNGKQPGALINSSQHCIRMEDKRSC